MCAFFVNYFMITIILLINLLSMYKIEIDQKQDTFIPRIIPRYLPNTGIKKKDFFVDLISR